MVATDRVRDILSHARALHSSSIGQLAEGDVSAAAEQAWQATKMATDALILARFNIEPDQILQTSKELNRLAEADPCAEILVDRYYVSLGYLHEEIYQLGMCDPIESAELCIREIAEYIQDASGLAETVW